MKKSKPIQVAIQSIELPQVEFEPIYAKIRKIIDGARCSVYKHIDSTMVLAYWDIGKTIVEEEQKGAKRAEYGKNLVLVISRRMVVDYGKGYSPSTIKNMRRFYLEFPDLQKRQTPFDFLSWSNYLRLFRVKKFEAREFYHDEAQKNNWSNRELDRQINSQLYERLLMSKNKGEMLKSTRNNQLIEKPEDAINDPLILEFLNLPDRDNYQEKDLEKALINKLQHFLLELGKGFAFVASQKRFTTDDGEHHYIDLVLYNFLLKAFVIIEIKVGKLNSRDIGQLDFYVNYWEDHFKVEGDRPTIGIILCAEKSNAVVRYSQLNESQKLFASEYKLYLPSEEELRQELLREKQLIEIERQQEKEM